MKSRIILGMITLNEEHNLREVLPIARVVFDEIIIVDSGSTDGTLKLCQDFNVKVYTKEFEGFGKQWNFLLRHLNEGDVFVKFDPDERFSPALREILENIVDDNLDHGIAYSFIRRWHLLGKRLNIRDEVVRAWKIQSSIRFSTNSLNERPIGYKQVKKIKYSIEHLDSPCLEHWIIKNNHYSSLEAANYVEGLTFDTKPGLANKRSIKMLIKKHFFKIPFRYLFVFVYFYFIKGLVFNGYRGYLASLLWTSNYLWKEIKIKEKTTWK